MTMFLWPDRIFSGQMLHLGQSPCEPIYVFLEVNKTGCGSNFEIEGSVYQTVPPEV
jgi:hypothetical protein